VVAKVVGIEVSCSQQQHVYFTSRCARAHMPPQCTQATAPGAAAVLPCVLQIATADQLEPATRSLAAECLVTLCEARDKVGAGA
jgi:hypothetical protein